MKPSADLWTRINTNPDFFPTPEQELLLHAALDNGAGAIRSWESWRSRVDIEQLDTGSHRLLPLLYRNLVAQGVDDPLLARIKGVYRRTWYENQLLFAKLSRILCHLSQAGIRTMLLKGVALSLGHYRDGGVRPMDDFDVLVPYKDAVRAMDLMSELGYRSSEKMSDRKAIMATWRGWEFMDKEGYRFDLHWNSVSASLGEGGDDDFWREAVPLHVNSERTLMLCPTDQLLHVCFHGAAWSPIPPIRWVADAMTIWRTSREKIDWSRLLIQARRIRRTMAAADTLEYLRDQFKLPVPQSVLHSLRGSRTPYLKQLTYRALARSPERRGLAMGLLLHLMDYVKVNQETSLWRVLSDFPAFLRQRWGLVHSWEIPVYIVSNGVRRTWQKRFRT